MGLLYLRIYTTIDPRTRIKHNLTQNFHSVEEFRMIQASSLSMAVGIVGDLMTSKADFLLFIQSNHDDNRRDPVGTPEPRPGRIQDINPHRKFSFYDIIIDFFFFFVPATRDTRSRLIQGF